MLRGLYACAGGERNKFGGELVSGGMVVNREVHKMGAPEILQDDGGRFEWKACE
jgi:hypothetical protein